MRNSDPGTTLRSVLSELLDTVVARDARVTRAEDRLDQLCDVLLLKLESDRARDPSRFRAGSNVRETAEKLRLEHRAFVERSPDIFRDDCDHALRLGDDTIARCVELLAPLPLLALGATSVSTAFQVLRAASLKQGEGQYFTPEPVIRAAVKLLAPTLDDRVIDPACGTGGFLFQTLAHLRERHDEASIARFCGQNLHGIDKDATSVKLTRAILSMSSSSSVRCARADAIVERPFEDGSFTLVLTNPPFGANLTVSSDDARDARLDLALTPQGEWSSIEIGLLFLNRAVQLLAPGGRLGIVLPETYFFSSSYRFVRAWIERNLRPRFVANVPMEAFQGFCRAKTNLYVFEKSTSRDPEHVVFMDPRTCGLDKDGKTLRRMDEASGARTEDVDDELNDQVDALLRGETPLGSARVHTNDPRTSVLVPKYHDPRFDEPFDRFLAREKLESITLGELEKTDALMVRPGHGSPSSDLRRGDIPYLKVSDLRAMRMNVNPTNLVSEAIARRLWGGEESGLRAWDLITPNRASANIGEFVVLLPGEERVVLTKEVFVFRAQDPFYLLWALSLSCVRDQWRRVTFMQTNREDVGDRYREVRIPRAPSPAWAAEVARPFREYFTALATSRTRFAEDLRALSARSMEFIASVHPRRP